MLQTAASQAMLMATCASVLMVPFNSLVVYSNRHKVRTETPQSKHVCNERAVLCF